MSLWCVFHVPRRMFELRQDGHQIVTSWVWRTTGHGERHRVGLYSLEVSQ
ncbi:helix-turn-helix domain-containing protein [Paraburkholderia hayleyella]